MSRAPAAATARYSRELATAVGRGPAGRRRLAACGPVDGGELSRWP
jgi:hypothetical protein